MMSNFLNGQKELAKLMSLNAQSQVLKSVSPGDKLVVLDERGRAVSARIRILVHRHVTSI